MKILKKFLIENQNTSKIMKFLSQFNNIVVRKNELKGNYNINRIISILNYIKNNIDSCIHEDLEIYIYKDLLFNSEYLTYCEIKNQEKIILLGLDRDFFNEIVNKNCIETKEEKYYFIKQEKECFIKNIDKIIKKLKTFSNNK